MMQYRILKDEIPSASLSEIIKSAHSNGSVDIVDIHPTVSKHYEKPFEPKTTMEKISRYASLPWRDEVISCPLTEEQIAQRMVNAKGFYGNHLEETSNGHMDDTALALLAATESVPYVVGTRAKFGVQEYYWQRGSWIRGQKNKWVLGKHYTVGFFSLLPKRLEE